MDWQAAIFAFVAAHRHVSSLVWLSVPAASSPVGNCALSQHVACVKHSQPASALATIMELLLDTAKTACSFTNLLPAPEHDPQDTPVLSDTDCIVCSMLLVLHMITLLNCRTHDSTAATPHFVEILCRLSGDLPDETSAHMMLTAQPKCINSILAVKVVQQLMSLLRQSMKRVPIIAKVYMDVLLKLRPFASQDQAMTDELVCQGAAQQHRLHTLTAVCNTFFCFTQASACMSGMLQTTKCKCIFCRWHDNFGSWLSTRRTHSKQICSDAPLALPCQKDSPGFAAGVHSVIEPHVRTQLSGWGSQSRANDGSR